MKRWSPAIMTSIPETSEVGAGAHPELRYSYIWDDFQLIASNYP